MLFTNSPIFCARSVVKMCATGYFCSEVCIYDKESKEAKIRRTAQELK